MDERRLFARMVLGFLAIGPLVTGIWAVTSPTSFYESFPGLGRHWISADGPFNRHLIIDAGAGFLAVGVLTLMALLWLRREVIQVAMAAYLFHALPHVIYHVTHRVDELSTTDLVLGIGSLGMQIALATTALIAISTRPSDGTHEPATAERVRA